MFGRLLGAVLLVKRLTIYSGPNCHLCEQAKAILYPVLTEKGWELVEKDDLVITADIPLAAEVIDKGGKALNPRGELYTKANIKARLNKRDFMDSMRNSGVQVGGGPPPLTQRDRMEFANALDKYVAEFNK